MPELKPPSYKVLEFAVPREVIEAQLENWLKGTVKSNDELATALKRLRDSYCALLAGKTVKDDDEILMQVEAALTQADKAKKVV
jgi:hypothetical protein